MLEFAVNEKKNRALRERMEALGVYEQDIEEKFIRSSGKGGQKVNKTATCVYLKHLPTGLEVKCMEDRSQSVNRFLARRELLRKVGEHLGILTEEQIRQGRARKQKAKKARRAKGKYARTDQGTPAGKTSAGEKLIRED